MNSMGKVVIDPEPVVQHGRTARSEGGSTVRQYKGGGVVVSVVVVEFHYMYNRTIRLCSATTGYVEPP